MKSIDARGGATLRYLHEGHKETNYHLRAISPPSVFSDVGRRERDPERESSPVGAPTRPVRCHDMPYSYLQT